MPRRQRRQQQRAADQDHRVPPHAVGQRPDQRRGDVHAADVPADHEPDDAQRGAAVLQVEARDKAGLPLAGLNFFGRLERPSDKRYDREVALAEVGSGVYRGDADGVLPGRWDLVLEGDQGGVRMFLSKNKLLLN